MRINFKTLAGMAVCVLGVLSTSSCSKDEFFGLEDSVYLENSLKTEIAMSQEFADYMIACFNMAQKMKEPVDTSDFKIQGVVDGKPVYFETGSNESARIALEKLKKSYPELENADQLDFDEIQEIAFSNTKALKGIAPKKSTKVFGNQSNYWIYNASQGYDDWYFNFYDDGYWYFEAYMSEYSALSNVMWNCGESYAGYSNGGGLIFNDHSAVSMVGYGNRWPYIAGGEGQYGSVSPHAYADFIIVPSAYLPSIELYELTANLGGYYWASGRIHYIYNEELEYVRFMW